MKQLNSRLARLLAHPAFISLLLAAAALAVYYPAIHNGFVSFDDPDYVTANIHVKGGLTAGDVAWAFRACYAGNWHPLSWMSHMLDVQLYGLNPAGHHLTSLLFHALNSVLLFVLLRRFTGAVWRSAFVAALFALHPLHVESVVWVAERKDVLSAFFFMLTLWAYARYAEGRRGKAESRKQKAENGSGGVEVQSPASKVQGRWSVISNQTSRARAAATARRTTGSRSLITDHRSLFYLLSLFFFALGLMSKPMLVTVPFVLLLLDYWPLGRMKRDECGIMNEERKPSARRSFILHPSSFILLEKLPFFLLSLLSCLITVLAQQRAIQPLANLSVGARVGNAVVAYVRYLGKTFWPLNLATPYPHPGHWPLAYVLLAAALLAGLTLAALWSSRRYPFVVTGWFWFLGTLVPVIGFLQVGEQSMADRYTYLPLIGVFVMLVWGVSAACQGWQIRRPKPEIRNKSEARSPKEPASTPEHAARPDGPAASSDFGIRPSFGFRPSGFGFPQLALAGLAAAVLLACGARTRDQLRCWHDSESLYRHAVAVSKNNFIAYYNLGSVFDSQGRTDEALTNYFKAVAMQPHYPDPLINIGCILAERKQFADAIPYFEAALNSKPDYTSARENLANSLRELKRFGEAIPQFRLVVKDKPDDIVALNSLANELAGQRQYAEAISYYEASLRVKAEQPGAHFSFGNALRRLGRNAEAIQQYRLAVEQKPDFGPARYELGIALSREGKPGEALVQLREAVRVGPNNPDAHNALGAALASTARLDEAIAQFQEALRLLPESASAHFNLGKALATQGKPEEAKQHFTEALRLKPDFAAAQQELQALAARKTP